MNADRGRFYITGGTLPSHASSYIARQADIDLLDGLDRGEFCYVLNTRQIGKSSLMVRTARQLRAQGHLVALLDLTAIGQNITMEEWYDGLLTLLAEQLRMRDELEDFWLEHANLGPMQRWMEAIRRVILEQRPERLFVFVDEIDVVRSLPFSADEFFTGIRECYNRRVQDSALERLSFCLLGVATPADVISDTRMSPFNIGRRIVLSDFTLDEVLPLAQGLHRVLQVGPEAHNVTAGQNDLEQALPLQAASQQSAQRLLKRVLYWTNGHPYLTQRLCQALSRSSRPLHNRDVDRLCKGLFLVPEAQNTDDNLAFVCACLLRRVSEDAALLDLYRQVRLGRTIRDDTTNPLHTALRLAGIVRVVRGKLQARNRIYARVFDLKWIAENMPGAEMRRQRAAYKRGVARAATVFGSLAALIATLMILAIVNARHARAAEKRASHLLYISDINLIQREWEGGNTAHVLELLEETRLSEEKGLEWDYWNRKCHQCLRTFSLTGAVLSVALAPNKKQIAALNAQGLIKIWNMETGQTRLSLLMTTDACRGLAYSPDGTKLLVGVHGTVQIRDAVTGSLLRTLSAFRGDITKITTSPDGVYVAATTDLECACVWDAVTGKQLQTFGQANHGHHNPRNAIFDAGFTGKQLAIGRSDGLIQLWNLKTRKATRHLQTDFITGSIAFSHDGRRIAGRDRNGNVNIIDAWTGKPLVFLGSEVDLQQTYFSRDDRRIITAHTNAINVWDALSGRPLYTFKEHSDWIKDCSISEDGRYVASGAFDGAVKLWDTQQPADPLFLQVSAKPLWHVGYSADGARIVASGQDGCATIWDALTGRKLRTIIASKSRLTPAIFSHDGTRLFTGDAAGEGRLWDTRTGQLRQRFVGHSAAINGAAFSPDDRQIFTGSDDKTAVQWDAATGVILHRFQGHRMSVEAIALSADGTRLVTGGDDGKAVVWDVASGKALQTFGAPAEIWGVSLSPDAGRLAISNLRKTVEIWDLASNRRVGVLAGHTNWVIAVSFSPDGKRIVTSSRDATSKVWELQTGREVLTLQGHQRQVSDVTFSPDGRYIASAGADGQVIIWNATPTNSP